MPRSLKTTKTEDGYEISGYVEGSDDFVFVDEIIKQYPDTDDAPIWIIGMKTFEETSFTMEDGTDFELDLDFFYDPYAASTFGYPDLSDAERSYVGLVQLIVNVENGEEYVGYHLTPLIDDNIQERDSTCEDEQWLVNALCVTPLDERNKVPFYSTFLWEQDSNATLDDMSIYPQHYGGVVALSPNPLPFQYASATLHQHLCLHPTYEADDEEGILESNDFLNILTGFFLGEEMRDDILTLGSIDSLIFGEDEVLGKTHNKQSLGISYKEFSDIDLVERRLLEWDSFCYNNSDSGFCNDYLIQIGLDKLKEQKCIVTDYESIAVSIESVLLKCVLAYSEEDIQDLMILLYLSEGVMYAALVTEEEYYQAMSEEYLSLKRSYKYPPQETENGNIVEYGYELYTVPFVFSQLGDQINCHILGNHGVAISVLKQYNLGSTPSPIIENVDLLTELEGNAGILERIESRIDAFIHGDIEKDD